MICAGDLDTISIFYLKRKRNLKHQTQSKKTSQILQDSEKGKPACVNVNEICGSPFGSILKWYPVVV